MTRGAALPGPILMPWNGIWPIIDESAFLAPGAVIIGDVVIGPRTNIWFGVVIRGDVHEIRIGADSNLQDGTILHATQFKAGTYIGDHVTIGHGAILHACTLKDRCFIGMGAVVLDRAVVETNAMAAAGALIPPGKTVPTGELWAGNPAKVLRRLNPAEIDNIQTSADRYVDLGARYRAQIHGNRAEKTEE